MNRPSSAAERRAGAWQLPGTDGFQLDVPLGIAGAKEANSFHVVLGRW
jgi:hypothetical protein